MSLDVNIDLNNKVLAEKLSDDLAALIPVIRDRRKPQIEQWLLNHSAWRAKHTRQFFHSPTFNHYVPAFRRSIEKFVVRGAQMLMPTNEFFEVFPANEASDADGQRAESVMACLLYLTRKKIKVYSLVKQLLRCHRLYGRAIIKTYLRVIDKEVWPLARSVDPFTFTVFPETVNDLENASLLFEDCLLPFEQYEAMAIKSKALPIDRSKLCDVTWPDYIVRRLQHSGLTSPTEVPNQANQTSDKPTKRPGKTDWVALTEVWVAEKQGWRFCWLVWNLQDKPQVVKVSKLFKRPSYRISIDRDIPGEQYTSSMGDDLEPIQVVVNDQVNMFMEGQAMALCGPIALDPSYIARRNSIVYKPRAVWLVPPSSAQKIDIPDVSGSGLKGIHFGMGLMESFSGSSPLSEGQPIRNLPRSGGAVSSLLNMSLADIRDAAKSIEDDILAPMLGDLHRLMVEFVPETQVMHIPGTQWWSARNITIKHISGDWDFNWVGSIQAKDLQERAARFMSFLETLAKLGPMILPDMASRGYRMNWTAIFKKIWREGLGERGADSLIEKVKDGTPMPKYPDTVVNQNVDTGGVEQLIQQMMGGGMVEPAGDEEEL